MAHLYRRVSRKGKQQSRFRPGDDTEWEGNYAANNQIFGAMNRFYKYDNGGVGAYNLAHPNPAVGAQHCLTADEHCEVSTMVYELL